MTSGPMLIKGHNKNIQRLEINERGFNSLRMTVGFA